MDEQGIKSGMRQRDGPGSSNTAVCRKIIPQKDEEKVITLCGVTEIYNNNGKRQKEETKKKKREQEQATS